jgi:hypothetical protein
MRNDQGLMQFYFFMENIFSILKIGVIRHYLQIENLSGILIKAMHKNSIINQLAFNSQITVSIPSKIEHKQII